MQSLKDDDADCRFNLPRETVTETYIDEDGHLHIQCLNGNINGYNDICVSCLRCNMDIKYVGSGTAAMAMVEYVTNYIAKMSLDSTTVFAALCGAIKSVNDNPPINPLTEEIDPAEKSRLVLLKTCNSMIGKRELSGQQVVSFLCNIPNHFTNHQFDKLFWTSILNFACPNLFEAYNLTADSDGTSDESNPDPIIQEASPILITNATEQGMVMLDSICKGESVLPELPQQVTYVQDVLYRPVELQHLSLWDLFSFYASVRLPKEKKKTKLDSMNVTNENASEQPSDPVNNGKVFQFLPDHPKCSMHCFKLRAVPITPVLLGRGVPRRDKENTKDAHAAAMLMLFKPWSSDQASLLKLSGLSWSDAYEEFLLTASPAVIKIIDNMQAVHECKDAAHDYAAVCSACLAELKNIATAKGICLDDTFDNPLLNAAMEVDTLQDLLPEDFDIETLIDGSNAAKLDLLDSIDAAEKGGLYSYPPPKSNQYAQFSGKVSVATANDRDLAEYARNSIQQEKKDYFKSLGEAATNSKELEMPSGQNSVWLPKNPMLTNMEKEEELARKKFLKHCDDEDSWNTLKPYQQVILSLIEKYTLNEEQTLAFLIFSDHHGRQSEGQEKLKPLRMMLGGPGSAGKSQVFDAIKEFYICLNHGSQLKVTAPTGLAANNVGGSTIHSEASLRVSRKTMYSSGKNGETCRTKLEERWTSTTAHISDEIYFLRVLDFALMSENLRLAKHVIEEDGIFGNLDVLFAEDPAQLGPPNATSLYDHKLAKVHTTTKLNGLNENHKRSVEGMVAWSQVDVCVVLKLLMRQKDPIFQALLTCLCVGVCTEEDYIFLQQFLIKNRSSEVNCNKLSITKWIDDPTNASPLICFTNRVRDEHNMRSTKAFAEATNQPFHLYHSFDYTSKGRKKKVLRNAAAEAAWAAPIKAAKNLSGKLPLIPGMPVFLVENIATELGLSNGSEGTLVSVKYEEAESHRYAVSVDVDFPSYNNPSKSHPHHVTLGRIKQPCPFTLPSSTGKAAFSCTREQIPIIPAFAYTAHNSQGRSLNAACLDLASCNSLAMAYVMLSRLRTLDGITILRPFAQKQIDSHTLQAVRDELKQLDKLAEVTSASACKELS